MRILIVGAGALGGYYGARLIAAQQDVTFLVRPARAQQLAAEGLHVLSPKGDLHIPSPTTILSSQITTPFHLILLSCKAYDLVDAMESFAPAVSAEAETAILPLLNGLAHMDALDQRFGRQHVLGGAGNISAVRSPDGTIRHLNTLDRILYGDRDHPASPRMQRIAAAFASCNFESHLQPNIQQDLWNKWSSISTYAAITCLMRATVGDIIAAGALPIALALLAETASIAAAEGFPVPADYFDQSTAVLSKPGSPFTASMLRDLESNAPIEAHQILGDLLARAHKHALPTPILTIAHAHVRCYEERRKRQSADST